MLSNQPQFRLISSSCQSPFVFYCLCCYLIDEMISISMDQTVCCHISHITCHMQEKIQERNGGRWQAQERDGYGDSQIESCDQAHQSTEAPSCPIQRRWRQNGGLTINNKMDHVNSVSRSLFKLLLLTRWSSTVVSL